MVNEDTGVRQLVRHTNLACLDCLRTMIAGCDADTRRYFHISQRVAERIGDASDAEVATWADFPVMLWDLQSPTLRSPGMIRQAGGSVAGRYPPDVPVPYVMTVGLYLGALARAVSVDPMMAHVYAAASPDVLAALSEVPIHGLLVRLLDERAHFRPSYGIDLIMAEHVSSVDRMQAVIGAVAGTYGLRHRA